MAKTCLMNGECWIEKCDCPQRRERDMSKKDEEVRVINRLYNQATKWNEGEQWYNDFLRFIKGGLSPLMAAVKATRENVTLNTLYETRPLTQKGKK